MDDELDISPLMGIMMIAMMVSMFPQQQSQVTEPASLSGIVTDDNGAPISGVQLSIASQQANCTTDAAGGYEMTGLTPGDIVSISVDNAGTLGYNAMPLVQKDLVPGPNFVDFVLVSSTTPPEPPETPPDTGGWTSGVTVTVLEAEPSMVYLGEEVSIKAFLRLLPELVLPVDIAGKVAINGTELTGLWTIKSYSAVVVFKYTPTVIGTFLVTAQDKQTTITVTQDVAGTFYMPWGGERIPVCTKIIVPNVAPFSDWRETFAGGNYTINGRGIFSTNNRQVIAQLGSAYPTEWGPTGAVVSSYVSYIDSNVYFTCFIVLPTVYTCREHWDTREELAGVLESSTSGLWVSVPDSWKAQYGITCPDCGGTGVITYGPTRRCGTCNGTGSAFRVNFSWGWKDWIKEIRYSTSCGSGYCVPRMYCPYCELRIEGSSHASGVGWDRISFMRRVLDHIESAHPSHPLTTKPWV